jgi:glycosyltransferase involved in cell wall biosynthesis
MADLSVIQHESPCVSVIVTTYKRVKLLQETLESILSQSFTDFELIVVDNMSEDGTQQFIAGVADSRIRYFRNPNHGIIAANRNFGIRQATGRYIAFCDDDDLWLVNKLEEQVSLLEQHIDVALCYTQAESFIGLNVLSPRMNRRKVLEGHFIQLLRGNFFPNSSVLIRRSVFQKIGMLTEDPTLREDFEMWLRISKVYRLMGIEKSLIRYRVHATNAAGNRAAETLRAIRTVKSIAMKMQIPRYIIWPNLAFQFIKYFLYLVTRR